MKSIVLLIDDDIEEIKILVQTLQDAGIICRLTWASSAQHAFEMLKYLQFDIIFVDYNMPKINGIDCIKTLRELPGCKQTTIILYSSEITSHLTKKATELNVMSLQKTHELSLLGEQLKKIFSTLILPPAI